MKHRRAGKPPPARYSWMLSRLAAAADAGGCGFRRADVEAGVGRILGRRLAVLDVLQEVDGLVAHLEGTLADLALGVARLQEVDLDGKRVGDDEGESAAGDLVLVLVDDGLVGVRNELREA